MTIKQHKIGRYYQEYHQAKRTLDAINKAIRLGQLPENHKSIKINEEQLKEAKKQLKKLGIIM